jgi:hypothetical protein
MRELIDVQKEMQAHEESVNDIYQKLVQGEQIVSIIIVFTLAAVLKDSHRLMPWNATTMAWRPKLLNTENRQRDRNTPSMRLMSNSVKASMYASRLATWIHWLTGI